MDAWIPAARAARHRAAGVVALVGFIWIAYLLLTGPQIQDQSAEIGERSVTCSSAVAGSTEASDSAQLACDHERGGRLARAVLAAPVVALLGAVYVIGDVEPRRTPAAPT